MDFPQNANKSCLNKKGKGATKHCAYGTCKSDSRYPDRPEMEEVFFVRFPQLHRNPEKCEKWARACGRQGFDKNSVKKDTYICSLHFVGGKGPTEDKPDPIPATATKYDVERLSKVSRRASKARRTLQLEKETTKDKEPVNETEVAEILLSLKTQDEQVAQDSQDGGILKDQEKAGLKRTHAVVFENSMVSSPKSPRLHFEEMDEHDVIGSGTRDVDTQTDTTLKQVLALKIENFELKRKLEEKESEAGKSGTFSIDDIKHDDKKMVFYTGLSFAQFMCLWRFLGPAVNMLSRFNKPRKHELTPSKSRGPKRKLTPMNELLLTLMRLRLGLLNQDLAYRFGISVSTVSDVVSTWVQFMYLQFDRLRTIMFPPLRKIRKHLPRSFKKFKNVRVILDATEFFAQAPRNYEQQGNMYSSYKNHCTCKVLIGITPSGAISFVSDVFEGSISDKEILKKSKLLDKLDHGDMVMVDRGFNVRDLLLERGADIVIPPFLGDREKLTAEEEKKTKIIAKLRIHVERVIERIKKYKILKKIVPLNTLQTFSQTVFVVACLINFQQPIVK